MRLLRISSVLKWLHLMVYEEVDPNDYLSIPYSKVTDEMWQESIVLSWRWNEPKPVPDMVPGFSPMSKEQWNDLLALLQTGESNGFKYCWIDCEFTLRFLTCPY